MNVMVFDIETVPDVDAGRRLYGLDGLGDKEIAQVMFTKRREQTGDSEFLPLHLHRVVAISVVLRHKDDLRVWSLGSTDSDEAELIARFYRGLEEFTPTLVSWNGSGFDLPVLHYRSLVHGVSAARYWDTGDGDKDFRWNNYLSRYHARHTDLMDVLSGYQPRGYARLDELAVLLGLPGKMDMSGADVWSRYLAGELGAIRDYCETDVVNTYLIYLRWELVRGRLDKARWREECARVRSTLAASGRAAHGVRGIAQPGWPRYRAGRRQGGVYRRSVARRGGVVSRGSFETAFRHRAPGRIVVRFTTTRRSPALPGLRPVRWLQPAAPRATGTARGQATRLARRAKADRRSGAGSADAGNRRPGVELPAAGAPGRAPGVAQGRRPRGLP